MTPEEILQQAEEQKRQTSSATQTGTKPEQPLTPSFSSEADIDARLTEMLMADAKADKEREEKRLQRQAAARSLTDLGGAFIDMIKASEGATVSPRSLEQHYNRLDDRQKQVYDAYRARVDLLRRQKADRDRVRAAEARRAAEVEARLKTQKEIAAMQEEGRDRRAKERMNRMRIANYYGAQRKPEDDYFIDFGNGETKDYKNNTKEGRNVYAAIYQYLHKQGIIPDLEDKDGNVVPVKDQKTADFLVRQYLDYAMQYPEIKSAIYKIVMGKDKDFRDPPTRSIDQYGQQHRQDRQTSERPAWSLVSPPQEGGGVNLPVKPKTDVSTFTF